jgi:hypothetical protein
MDPMAAAPSPVYDLLAIHLIIPLYGGVEQIATFCFNNVTPAESADGVTHVSVRAEAVVSVYAPKRYERIV